MRRYLETAFRYKEIFLVPVILIPALAILIVAYTGREYKLEARVWVDPSRLLEDLSIGSSRSSPSAVEGKAMQEWLTTDAFRAEVVQRSGLGAAVDDGKWPVPSTLGKQLAKVPVVRSVARRMGVVMPVGHDEAMDMALKLVASSLTVTAEGNNLLLLTYRGRHPVLGQRLLQETLTHYNERITARQVEDSRLGVDFYSRQTQIQKVRLDQAAEVQRQYLAAYPDPLPGQSRPAAEQAELQRLDQAHTLERTLYEASLRKLEDVRVSGEAALSGRLDSFLVVDMPPIPDSPGLPTKKIVTNLVLGIALGLMVGVTPVLVLTWGDNQIRTRADVEEALSVPLLAEIPELAARKVSVRSSVATMLSPGGPAASARLGG